MYVSGKVKDADNVLINIGTGYYIEKVCQKINHSSRSKQKNLFQDIVGAKDYFDRKVKYVTEQMEKIQVIGIEKSKIRDCRCKKYAKILYNLFWYTLRSNFRDDAVDGSANVEASGHRLQSDANLVTVALVSS
jgi:hypothetical protein